MEQKRLNPIPIRPVNPDLGTALMRAAFARLVARARNAEPDDVVRELFRDDPAAVAIVQRTAVLPLTGGGNGALLIADGVRSFLAGLQDISAAARLIASGMTVTLDRGATFSTPFRTGGPVVAPWIEEGEPIRVYAPTLDDLTVGPVKKLSMISVVSRSLVKRAAGQTIVEQLLREDAARSLDAAWFSSDDTTSAGARGLLYGLSAIVADTSTGREALANDLAALASAVSANGSGRVLFVMHPSRAASVPLIAPDIRADIAPSLSIPAGQVVAIDPLSIVNGIGDAVDMEASTSPTLHMNDTPAEIVSGTGPTAAAPVRSVWQTDMVALRILIDVAFTPRRTDAVAYLEPTGW